MNTSWLRIVIVVAVIAAISFLAGWDVIAQNELPSLQSVEQDTSTPPGMSPAQAEIWNSPQMIRARKWLNEYCQRSARISPAEATQYKQELESLTPTQMKLWLLKFEHEDEQRRQQYQAWQKAHQLALSHALSMQRSIQQSYADINRGESEGAQLEESELRQENRQAALAQQDKADELNTPGLEGPDYVGPYGYGSFPDYGGWGGVHYHFHIYP